MNLTIHDVGHGSCISVLGPYGDVMVFDCGHKTDPEYRPSYFLRASGFKIIDQLWITNFDEDHISDFPNLTRHVQVPWIFRNPTISPAQLAALKRQSAPLSDAMSSLIKAISPQSPQLSALPPALRGIDCKFYYNSYVVDFNDTNNLSVVAFVHLGNIHAAIPGDIEAPGWRRLLQRPGFAYELSRVNLFVASHHGRESGYCREVFNHCHPEVVVFSDSAIQYATQQMANLYASHSKGIHWRGQTRKVLSTRKDGSLFFSG